MNIHKDHNGVAVKEVFDQAGDNAPGHNYLVTHGDTETLIKFQCGAVPLNGVNGLTNEALLAILIHRTTQLNKLFPCAENFRAISHMEEALVNLEVRTARRMVRGVEGKEVL